MDAPSPTSAVHRPGRGRVFDRKDDVRNPHAAGCEGSCQQHGLELRPSAHGAGSPIVAGGQGHVYGDVESGRAWAHEPGELSKSSPLYRQGCEGL